VGAAPHRIAPARSPTRSAAGVSGRTRVRSWAGAGHRLDFDAPAPLAKAVLDFLK
jgi:hypothetical protein